MTLSTTYTEIAARLRSELPELRFVSLFNSQFSRMGEEIAIPFPAILLEFSQVNWTTNSQGWQQGNAVITLHVGQQNFADPFNGSHNEEKALEVLDFLGRVNQALQGWGGTVFGSLDRIATITDIDHDHVVVHLQQYSLSIIDTDADLGRDRVEATPELEVVPEIDVRVAARPPAPDSPFKPGT